MSDDDLPGAHSGVPDDMDALDPVLARAATVLRKPVTLGRDFDDWVMTAVHSEARPLSGPASGSQAGSVRRWATTPCRIPVSPVGSVALAAGVAAVLVGAFWLGRRSVPGGSLPQGSLEVSAGVRASRPAATQAVEFVVAAPGAGRVSLVGDFNEWNPAATALRATEREGVWSVTVPLTSGRHEYAFVVDGERWMADPGAPPAASDDFGIPNSVVTVSEPS